MHRRSTAAAKAGVEVPAIGACTIGSATPNCCSSDFIER